MAVDEALVRMRRSSEWAGIVSRSFARLAGTLLVLAAVSAAGLVLDRQSPALTGHRLPSDLVSVAPASSSSWR
ncbi:hypothetical protein [Dactylosporangium sp. CA-139066]|uniref:hypothetical protein n=1 Tax=Dactylosporangium sp. CA-139066 TaxID=3239930 RepID=UPI003D89CE65